MCSEVILLFDCKKIPLSLVNWPICGKYDDHCINLLLVLTRKMKMSSKMQETVNIHKRIIDVQHKPVRL